MAGLHSADIESLLLAACLADEGWRAILCLPAYCRLPACLPLATPH